ncbi:MAG: glycosyltransferase, partial [Nanopusillaceae archaeon]
MSNLKFSVYPKISIITPSLNQGLFLESCIKSVISQQYPNLEYIVLDGGSTDLSKIILKKYSDYITFWRSEKDKGQYFAIQEGIERSTGEIIMWL